MSKVFVFDHSRCNGCRNCQLACKDEHVGTDWLPYALSQPDTGQFWLKLEERVRGQVPKVKVAYTPVLCQHCASAPCRDAAEKAGKPDAVYRRDDGLVIFDPAFSGDLSLATALVESCPFSAAWLDETRGCAQKCTGCAHLVDAGELPHCVDVCPHEALRFGEEEDFAAEIAAAGYLLDSEASAACKPQVYYLNKPKRFIGGIVVDLEIDEVLIGAKVTLENLETGDVRACETDEFGDFWFQQIDAAHYKVYVEAQGYMTRVVEASCVHEDINIGPVAMSRAFGEAVG
ncbi:MAG: carboxypeptidase regulatory-like domain-containing protein [Coriobacteriaceae bacterium]|jgi:Fe-S-cluster-containing dehydrogenase component|nr:carboxypeptidase regulatory-like domain-containing protein [Coriobacteriaceae bacterium]